MNGETFDKEILKVAIRDGIASGIREGVRDAMKDLIDGIRDLMPELRNIMHGTPAEGRESEIAHPRPRHEFTGADLREFRRLLGLTQEELSERLGIHITTISRMERDERQIPRTAIKLAEQIMKNEGIRKLVNFKIP